MTAPTSRALRCHPIEIELSYLAASCSSFIIYSSSTQQQSQGDELMIAAKLAVVTVLALLLGSASCRQQASFGNGNGGHGGNPIPITITQPPKHPPAMPPKPKPPAYHPPKTSPSTPPPTFPPTSLSPPPTTPRPSYPPTNPSPPPPKATPPPTTPSYPPTNQSPPPPTPIRPPTTPSYPPKNPSPPPATPMPTPPPTTPSYPPTNPSPPPPTPTPTPTLTPPPPTPTPTYPPTSPNPPPPPPSSPPPANSDDAGKKLKVGYYEDKCGHSVDVEAIVRKHVSGFDDIKAGLIQLFFHDCFVRGCDASILLDPTSTNQQPEKFGVPNYPSLRGYEVIDAAKDELEAECPGVVSCADIVAFAARDASYFLSGGGISFDVPAGRYDGTVSLANETLPNLPPPFAGFDQLEKMFADKGLNAFDMVTLSGAHSIGRSHCSSLPSSRTSEMDPAFAATLQASCASANGTDNTVMQDYKTPNDMDNQYYQNVLDRKVLFTSDAALTSDDMAKNLVRVYAIFPWLWQDKFAEAMVKMGRIEIKTDSSGEIRKNCRVVNSKP